MRITGGTHRGYQIQVPKVSDLRPSQDIVREAILGILGDLDGKLVLDIYAGTGALGIEALSRGAKSCDFVEIDKDACRTIESNVKNADFIHCIDVYCEAAESFVMNEVHEKYDIIFLDPPYVARPRSVLRMLPRFLSDDGVIVYLHGKVRILEEAEDRQWFQENLEVTDERRYGATHVSFLKKRNQVVGQ